MYKNDCIECPKNKGLSYCTSAKAPKNAYFEDIINRENLAQSNHLICAKLIDDLDKSANQQSDFPFDKNLVATIEDCIFTQIGLASIIWQKLFPMSIVATEVQAKGHSRNKRIDLTIFINSNVYFIKVIKKTDKYLLYSRSYNELIEHYKKCYPNLNFFFCILTHSNELIKENPDFYNLETLFNKIKDEN